MKTALVPFGNSCYPVEAGANSTNGRYLSGFFFSPLLFDCLSVIVFIAYALSRFKFKLSLASDFTRHFMREGFLYFLAISTINFANSAMTFQNFNVSYSGVVTALSMLLPNIFACRLVINLRRRHTQQRQNITAVDPGTVASFGFKGIATPSRFTQTVNPLSTTGAGVHAGASHSSWYGLGSRDAARYPGGGGGGDGARARSQMLKWPEDIEMAHPSPLSSVTHVGSHDGMHAFDYPVVRYSPRSPADDDAPPFGMAV